MIPFTGSPDCVSPEPQSEGIQCKLQCAIVKRSAKLLFQITDGSVRLSEGNVQESQTNIGLPLSCVPLCGRAKVP